MIRKLVRAADVDDDGIDYPEEDGKPLGETGYHVDCSLTLYGVLQWYFAQRRPDIHLACDMFFYYEKGNPKANKAPDVMATKGVGNHTRRTFKTWVENAVPCTIFEIVSRKTRREDVEVKPLVYARLGVKELFLFDPEGDARLRPPYQAMRLRKGVFVPMKPEADGGFTSLELGLRFRPEGHLLRVIELDSGMLVPFFGELSEQAQEQLRRAEEEKRRAEAEKRRADELQEEVQRLQAQLHKRGTAPR